MPHLLTAFTAFALLLGLQQNLWSQQTNEFKPKVGQLHPEFVMPSIVDGSPIQALRFRGQKSPAH